MGEKLQSLIDGNCVIQSAVASLTPAQKQAIEDLPWSQVYAMREARQITGELVGFFMI